MRRIRHLPIFDQPVYLEIHPIRYSCEHCGNGTTTTEQYEWVMWILCKQHECLSETDKDKLELLYKYSPTLKKAHSYALQLTCIFNTHYLDVPYDIVLRKQHHSNLGI